MGATIYQLIKDSLRQPYLDNPRPWLVGFSGGKDSTLVASPIVETVASIPSEQRKKPVAILCTDHEITNAEWRMTNSRMPCVAVVTRHSSFDTSAPPSEQSFWVNIIGRGYPPPNRTFRWCTQRMKIDPVTTFVKQRMGHGENSHGSIAINLDC